MKRRMVLSEISYQLLEGGKTLEDIGQVLGVTKQAVWQYCQNYGINLKKRSPRWYAKRLGVPELEDETWLLEQRRENDNLSHTSLAKKLGISEHALVLQMKRLKLNPRDFIYQGKVTVYCSNCNRPLQRYKKEIRRYKHFFCDKKCQGQWLAKHQGKDLWTFQEEQYIIENWQSMTDKAIGQHLNRSESAVGAHRLEVLHLPKRKLAKKESTPSVKRGSQQTTSCYFLSIY